MAVTTPQLDDRRFQDIVDEMKKRIPHYCREWTDHNVSDPGITLIELFAWMTEMILFRLNQVPDKHYINFMQMLGIRLREPAPAKVPVTFWLSAPTMEQKLIPAGTQVASTQTENERPIIFSTDSDLAVAPPLLSTVMTGMVSRSDDNSDYREFNVRRLASGVEGHEVFSSKPKIGDALYFGFENDLSQHVLGLDLEWASGGGAGINPNLPPLRWEVSVGVEDVDWASCGAPESDATKGLEQPGTIVLHLPAMSKQRVSGKELYWLRVRVRSISERDEQEGMRPYTTSPRLQRLSVGSWGGTAMATHSVQIQEELLGKSDGSPGQRFSLQTVPILRRRPGETLLVQTGNEPWEEWTEVADFAESTALDSHYTLDGLTGEIRLGPAVKQPEGDIKLYGNIPPRGANLLFSEYRTGGGVVGNVRASVLNTLKSSIPYVARVENRTRALGGADAELLSDAMVRAPATLRSRERAVSESDYEFLAQQALRESEGSESIGRVKCIQPRPSDAGQVVAGQVYLLVIPRVPDPARFIAPELLIPDEKDLAVLRNYLDPRRLLTVRLSVRSPAYHWVAVKVQLRAAPGSDRDKVESAVLSRLYRFLNPLVGGTEGSGWPFGRDLYASEVYQALQGVEEVLFLRNAEIFQTSAGKGIEGKPRDVIEVVSYGVVASGMHEVEFV